ncbi:hypothetical protein DFH11DRAFT_1546788 [Phellopilus nigrolimitatus]|nr:hypothetical protein DFH11DRAFT_1546788 [Phellopilus nigrolimitatus]
MHASAMIGGRVSEPRETDLEASHREEIKRSVREAGDIKELIVPVIPVHLRLDTSLKMLFRVAGRIHKLFMTTATLTVEAGVAKQASHRNSAVHGSTLAAKPLPGVGYKGYKIPKEGDILVMWRKGPWSDIMMEKELFINKPEPRTAVLDFIEDDKLRVRCQRIRERFFISNKKADDLRLQHQQGEVLLGLSLEEAMLPENMEKIAHGKPALASAVTYVEWMQAAIEDPSCTCCSKKSTTQ